MAWYHTYFQGLPQRAWKMHQEEEYTEYEVDFLRDVLEIEEGSKVLDLLSGYGRHAIPLSNSGCQLTCIDISSEYCDELTKSARKKGLDIEVICSDILDYQFTENQFDAAYCFGNSFSFFPRKDMLRFVENVASSLKSRAYFTIHTQNLAETVLPDFQTRNWMPVDDDITYLATNEYNALEGCIDSEQTFISGTEKVTHMVKQYIYSLAELSAMFENAGFETIGAYSNIEADPFALGDEHLYLLVRKL